MRQSEVTVTHIKRGRYWLLLPLILIWIIFTVLLFTVGRDNSKTNLKNAAKWHVDLDHDGNDELIVLPLSEFKREGRTVPYISDAKGNSLGALPPLGTTHDAYTTYALVDTAAGTQLMEYTTDYYNGLCEYSYRLWTVADGQTAAGAAETLSVTVSGTEPYPDNDIDAVLGFIDRINGIFSKATFLVSTARDTVLPALTTGGGKPLTPEAGMLCAIYQPDLEAPYLENNIYYTSESLHYQETLPQLSKELQGIAGFDANASLREQLAFSNHVLARSRALHCAAEAVGTAVSGTPEILSEEQSEDASWSFDIRMRDCQLENGAVMNYIVHVRNDEAVSMRSDDGSYLTEHSQREVYLTFDDGPCENTPQVLDILDYFGIRATFFTVGFYVNEYPEYAAETMRRGHLIACHSYTHDYSKCYASKDAFMDELRRWEQAVKSACGLLPERECVRFPGGSTTRYATEVCDDIKAALTAGGYHWFDWNAGDNDKWAKGNTKNLPEEEYFMESYYECMKWFEEEPDRPIIFLMHDTEIGSVNVLPKILRDLSDRGYSFHTLDQHPDWEQ